MTEPVSVDTDRDLVLHRVIDVPPDRVWRAWTVPKLLEQWFCPEPWRATNCEVDLRPGGRFRATMQSPDGQVFPHVGCFLEVEPHARLVWTTVLDEDYRPLPVDERAPAFTAVLWFAPAANGCTRYTAVARHRDAASRRAHEELGFHEGWNKAVDQLVQLMRDLP